MDNTQTLSRDEKINKISSIVRDNPVCMMATNLQKTPFSVYPMTTLELDDKGDLIFFTSKKASPFKEIEKDNRVQLLYANHDKQDYLSVFAHATHILDDVKLEKLWKPIMNNWFDGKHDPNLVILSVSIVSADYWITENNIWDSYLQTDNVGSGESGSINLQNYGDVAYKAEK
ncbi:pyridoxamine 5'-phosphate oxidase family protein [Aureibaculum sp. 2210JD6-5]|uniref:pyridoxamine 5'-phosphate oxidase family protein n=1 Tax=Aureibaculum sp. 2210JD6-5 TaxID=3103957 RepID=UPI002AADDA84|nr:pyridoxamine 5'-phosphate oxidase family protein [Aureibaculum sp. 2210JD6-5]MDY7394450.1 pyridoxamine 5'-phosphate oxidase family protein [Aureibaculum sp. 2210JD6-5]